MAKRVEYPSWFENLWTLYPNRIPDNPKKPAYKCCLARIREGDTITDLTTATTNYAADIRMRGKEGTDFVMMAQTFFGSNERWRGYLEAPKQPAPARAPYVHVVPRRITRTEDESREGLVSIRGIIDQLAKAKGMPKTAEKKTNPLDW